MSADSLLQRLIAVLDADLALHRRLLENAERKCSALMTHDLEALQQCVAIEEELTTVAGRHRSLREQLLSACARQVPGNAATIRIGALLEHVDGPQHDRIAALRDETRRVLGDLQRCNDRNQQLLRVHLGVVNDLLALIVGGETPGSAYDQRGTAPRDQVRQGGLLNCTC
ncbi:MAG: flagellar protein FlgN [Planctomycetota bacterium]